MPSCASCSRPCGPWSACSVTCGIGNRGRTNDRGCMDVDICTQPICPETTSLTTQGIYKGSDGITSTVASTSVYNSSAKASSKVAARDTGDGLLPVKVAVPVGVCLFVAVILTVFLLKRRSHRKTTKDGENIDAPTELKNISGCVTITREAEVNASDVIDPDIDRSSTYDINPLYDSSNTENYYNHVRRNETDIYPEYTCVVKRKHESSNQNEYTIFNGGVGNEKN
ncbi:uncharacterized protein LOC128236723 isoform X2 [Mya arenaria]|uniref:uncharacterized protein LOC128236470 isoform X2 n=1 Tax=Mya arenaria TaxID=6604 RepID=UPI0022E1E203|nr:uncharacterized protein LOC128236470 isoform X2 [Mya arenaria]XP_052807753.1 uncharacterized protein LOC128236723 isoform X2 [Mya arenaria]